MYQDIDLVVVGAGLSGCVIAERAAKLLNWKILIVERRNHVAGNCFDKYMENGLLVHQYGPHFFRTNNMEQIDYLSKFTSWIEGNYIVKSSFNNQLYPFPINIDTLEQFYGQTLNAENAKELLEGKRKIIDKPANSEEFVLSKVGREIYEAFYLNYTLKQWGKHPRELDPTVCGRIPIRFNRDNRYVEHQYQIMPKDGYTAMIQKMIEHPNIQVMLNVDYKELNVKNYNAIVYTGAIDDYFNFSLGRLPWRSLKFDYKEFDQEFMQPCVQINSPNEHDYTRSVEIKHVTKQIHPKTIVAYEYPTAIGEPYYPIPASENQELYEKYKDLAAKETIDKNVYFVGRLAEYAYLNMDEVIEHALNTFEIIRNSKMTR
jgi:UDP-galactopyranose mutase